MKSEVHAFLKMKGFEHTTIEVEPGGKLCELNDC